MKRCRWLALCLWFSWGVTACVQVLPSDTPATKPITSSATVSVMPTPFDVTPTASPIETMPHLLLESTGTVKLKRVDENWPDFQPIEIHTPLLSTDLLEVEDQAIILCAGTQQVTLETGISSVPCPRQPAIFQYNGADYNAPQRPGEVPYVLYPRRTLIFTERPNLIWRDTGAENYELTLFDQTGKLWTEFTTEQTEMAYPNQQMPLQSGMYYLLLVTDETEVEDQTPGIGFSMADASQLKEIRQAEQIINALPDLDKPTRTFILAVYYATLEPDPKTGLRPVGEAWRIFEALAETQNTPTLHLWRGYTLMEMFLPLEAETAFKAAIEAAENVGDLETQARAYIALGQLSCDKMYFNQAEILYMSLNGQTDLVQKGQEVCD